MLPKYIRKWGLSPSAIHKFEQCPARYEGEKLKKLVPFVESESMKWGQEVHASVEGHVKTGEVLPSWLQHLVPIIDGMRAQGYKLFAEIPMAVNSKWEACEWWNRDCMVRGNVDLFALNYSTLHALMIDWKTGKRNDRKGNRYDDDSQLEIYGLMALTALNLGAVESWFMWLKTKQVDKVIVNQENAQALRDRHSQRIAAMDEAYRTGNFPTKTSMLCVWCPFLETCDDAVLYRGKAKFMKGRNK